MLFRLFISCVLLGFLANCGFQPLYGRETQNAAVTNHLEATYVLPIDGRVGQIVRNALLDRVSPKGIPGSARYRLTVKLSEQKQGLAIDNDDSTNRFNLTLQALYTLTDGTGQHVVFQSSTQSIASYNIVSSDFANLSAEKNARKRAGLVIAENIHRDLSVHFSR